MPKQKAHRYITLAASESIALDAEADKPKLPERFRVFPWGTVDTPEGPVILDEQSAASIRRQNRIESGDTVVLDFEHNTVKGHPNYGGEPTSIAAHCRIEVVPNDGLYFIPTDWTDDGEKYVGGKHYKDVSLAARTDKNGRIRRVLSAGACREGEVEEVRLFSRSDEDDDDETISNDETENQNKPMDNEQLIAALREALGLDESAEPAAIMEKLTEKLADADVPEKKKDGDGGTSTLSIDLNDDEQVIALRKALGIDDLENERDIDLRDRLLSRAAREGKVVPEAARDLPPEKLEKIIEELPETVPVAERGGDVTLSRSLNNDNGYDEEMGKKLGITKERFEEFQN